MMSERKYTIVDSEDCVLFGLADLTPDHAQMIMLVPVIPWSEMEIGQTVAAVARSGFVFVKRTY